MLAITSPVAWAQEPGHSHSPHTDVWIPGTESMPPAPTGKEAQRLALLHWTEPTLETEGDISALVVTHSVWAKVAADEEWRSFYGSSWASEANARMETADNAMFTEFGIDFRVYSNATWTTSPNTSRGLCGSILPELVSDIPLGDADVVIGYTNNLSSGSPGCAQSNHTTIKLHGANTTERVSNVWKTSQHEFSHFFGAPDRYPDPWNEHPMDVMESQYAGANYWCTAMQYLDWNRVNDNAGKYD